MTETDSRISREERTDRLLASRQKVQEENYHKIQEAMHALQRARKPITVAGVAREADVARRTVYRSPYAAEIRELARRTAGKGSPAVRDMNSAASCERRLGQALEQIERLKDRLQKIKAENAVLQRQLDAAILRARQR